MSTNLQDADHSTLDYGIPPHEFAALKRENASLNRECAALRQVIDLHAASLWRATPESVLTAVADQAVKITGFRCAVVYEVNRDPDALTVIKAFGVDGRVEGSRTSMNDGFASRVARSGQPERLVGSSNPGDGFIIGGHEYDRAEFVPLLDAAKSVRWVLVVADRLDSRSLTDDDLRELEVFAAYAGVLVQMSRLWTWDERRFGQTEAIDRIESYMRTATDREKLLRVLLTGLTAGYGLCYSRAAIFLPNAAGDAFNGCGAVGSLSPDVACGIWEAPPSGINRFFEDLDNNDLPLSELDAPVRAISIPRGESAVGWMKAALTKGFAVVDPDTVRQHWPAPIIDTFNPISPVLLIVMRVGEEVDGFVIADNAFLPRRVEDHAKDANHLVGRAAKPIRALLTGSTVRAEENDGDDSPLREAYAQIVNTAMYEIFNGDRAALWLYDPEQRVFALRKYAGPDLPSELEWRLGGPLQEAIERGWVAVDDVERESRDFLSADTREMLLGLGVRSFEGFAMFNGDQALGVVCVGYNRSRTFDREHDSYIAAAFGGRAALVLRHAQLVERYRRARSAARVLAHSAAPEDSVGGVEAVDTVQAVQAMAQTTMQALQCHAVVIHEFEHSTSDLHTRPVVAVERHLSDILNAEAIADAGTWLAAATVDRTELWVVEDADREPRFAGGALASAGIRSAIIVPLIAGEHRVGVLCVGHARPYRYTREEREDARLFANQITQAIRLRQLYRHVTANAGVLSIGILNLNWKHRAGNLALTIEEAAKSIRAALVKGARGGDVDPDFARELQEYLDAITDSTPALRKPPVDDHFRENPQLVPINDFLKQWREKQSLAHPDDDVVAANKVTSPGGAGRINLECNAENTAVVKVNARWLGEVIDELVSNARKFAPDGVITLSTSQSETEVHVECEDTGPGIREEIRRLVGREMSPSHSKHGMGLGLYLVRTILMEYDGRLTAPDPTKPNSGAVLRITLPLARTAAS